MADTALLPALDAALRGGAIVLVLLIAALLGRDHAHSLAARLGAAFAVGVAAYSVCSANGFAPHTTIWLAPILALCIGNPIVFWLFARALFDDGFELRWWHTAIWATSVVIGFIYIFVLLPAGSAATSGIGIVLAAVPIVFAALAVAQSLAGWRGDLVEGRRRLRVFVTGATAGYIAIIGAAELALRGNPAPPLVSTINVAGIMALSAVIALSLLRAEGTDLFTSDGVVLPSDKPEAVAAEPPSPRELIREPERKLLSELDRLMSVERAHRQEGLTIGSLSLRLGIPEYRLRRMINRRLGYRNFAAFLNRYRIEEAKTALADPGQAEVPILTIAMDAGFQSLAPFNRAFKAETGLTPTEYRRRKMDKTSA
jgi:AraC-like DNA-binding protein